MIQPAKHSQSPIMCDKNSLMFRYYSIMRIKLHMLIGVAVIGLLPAAATAAPRPNIIFILVDDMGFGDLGLFYQNARGDQPSFSTPGLDRLGLDGLQMQRHYTPAPVCAPARASLLLGLHQGHANIRNNQFDQKLADSHTLGSVMRTAGYATACIGKWGLQGPGPPNQQPSHPLRRGFDYFFGPISHRAAHLHYSDDYRGDDDQGEPMVFLENETIVNEAVSNAYSTDLFTARAKHWIASHRDASPEKPFFLYLSYTAPHARLDVPTGPYPDGIGIDGGVQYLGTPGRIINTAAGTRDSWIHPDYADRDWPEHAKRHATMMRRIDDGVADLLATLRDLGIDEKTLVVFTSDNGPHNEAGFQGAHAYNPRFFDSFANFEGIKRDTLEGGLRVPTLVRWPGVIAPGRVDKEPSQFHDWLPTFVELAGLPLPAFTDGVSLVPLLTGNGKRRPSLVYCEYSNKSRTPRYDQFTTHGGARRGEMQVVFIDGFKGIRTGIESHDTPFRIHDTLADPGESTDLNGRDGVPTQQAFHDAVLRMRRADERASRPYDSAPIPPIAIDGLEPGVIAHAIAANSGWVVDGTLIDPLKVIRKPSPAEALGTIDSKNALVTAWLRVPKTGEYRFYLRANQKAFIRIHQARLIDACAGYQPHSIAPSGPILLEAGMHPVEIHFLAAVSQESHQFELSWSGPGFAEQPVPDEAWAREPLAR
jgi:uncharacterized sulfatase